MNSKLEIMFDLEDVLDKVDLGKIEGLAKKVGLDSDKTNKLKDMAKDALKYRVSKEKARGNENRVASMLSEKKNDDEDNKLASKLEGDFAFNLSKKLGLPDNVTNQLKGEVMQSFLGAVSKNLTKKNLNNVGDIVKNLGDSDMIDSFKDKFKNMF